VTKRKQWIVALAICGGLVFVGKFGTWAVYSAGWHIRHGRSLKCGSYEIPVPMKWWAAADDGAGTCLLMTKTPLISAGNEFVEAGFHVVSATPLPGDAAWRQTITRRLAEDGYALTSVREMNVAGAPAACFETEENAQPANHQILCTVKDRFGVRLRYRDQRSADEFYSILQGVRYAAR
jgi:hypothetical protein